MFLFLQNSLRSFKDCLFSADRILWAGWVFSFIALIMTTAYYFFWKFLLASLLLKALFVAPIENGEKTLLMVGLSILIWTILLMTAFSFLWLKADTVFYEAKNKMVASISTISAAVFILLGHGLGIYFLIEIIDLLASGRLEVTSLTIILFVALLLSPLLLRLYYLLPLAAIEGQSIVSPWKMILQGTRGQGPGLAFSVIPQLIIIVMIIIFYQQTIADSLNPLVQLLTDSEQYITFAALDNALSNYWQQEMILALLGFLVIVGPLLVVLSTMQVATLRIVFGLPSEEGEEVNFQVDNPSEKEAPTQPEQSPVNSAIPRFGVAQDSTTSTEEPQASIAPLEQQVEEQEPAPHFDTGAEQAETPADLEDDDPPPSIE